MKLHWHGIILYSKDIVIQIILLIFFYVFYCLLVAFHTKDYGQHYIINISTKITVSEEILSSNLSLLT